MKMAHDAEHLKVNEYLKTHDTSGLDLKILALHDACRYTLERVRNGKNTISGQEMFLEII